MKSKIFMKNAVPVIFFMVLMAAWFSFSLAKSKNVIAYIGYSMEKPYWVKMGKLIKAEAGRVNMEVIDLTPPTLNREEHRKFTEYAVEQNVDAIIFGANDVSLAGEAFDRALEKNIPVIAIDTAVRHPAVKGFIATDNFKSAQIAGEYIAEKCRGRGTVLILGGTKGHPNGDARRDGVTETCLASGMKVAFRQADWDPIKAFLFTKKGLTLNSDISAIFSCWDPGISVAAKVVEERGLSDGILLVGFDGLEGELKKIRSGDIDATIAQPMEEIAREGVSMVSRILKGEKNPGEKLIPGILVTEKNVNSFLNQ